MAQQTDRRSRVEVDTSSAFTDMMEHYEIESRLLGSQVNDESFDREDSMGTKHDRNSLPAMPQGSTISSDECDGSRTAILWKGLPLRTLVWELFGIFLAVCFLG